MSDATGILDIDVPNNWGCAQLIECTSDGQISYGIVQPGQHQDDGVPVIRVNNFGSHGLDLSDVLRVSPEIEAKYERTRLAGGEVILTLVGSTGQSAVVPSEMAGWNVPRAIAVIRAKDEVGADWLNLCLQSRTTKHFLEVRANTTVQKTLNLKDVRAIPIPLPPPHVKNQIESVARSLEQKIELNRQINRTLEQIAQAIFKSWFVDFEPAKAKHHIRALGGSDEQTERAAQAVIAGALNLAVITTTTDLNALDQQLNEALSEKLTHQNDAQREHLATTAGYFPDQLVKSELGLIPDGWEDCELQEFCGFQNGYAFKSKDWQESGYPVVKIGNVKPGFISLDGASFVGEETVNSLGRFELHAGDILVGMTGYPGETGLVPNLGDRAFLNQRVGRFLIDDKPQNYGFVYCTVRRPEFRRYVKSISHGSAQANVSGKSILSYPIVRSTEDLIRTFNALVMPMISGLLSRQAEDGFLSGVRESLLPKLLSGEIEVQEAT